MKKKVMNSYVYMYYLCVYNIPLYKYDIVYTFFLYFIFCPMKCETQNWAKINAISRFA